MMTARTDLDEANTLSLELDRITAALAIVNSGTFAIAATISSTPTSAPAFTFRAPISQAQLTTALQNRQAAIQARLTTLGVT